MYKPYWALNWGAGPVPQLFSPKQSKTGFFTAFITQLRCFITW